MTGSLEDKAEGWGLEGSGSNKSLSFTGEDKGVIHYFPMAAVTNDSKLGDLKTQIFIILQL